MNTSPRGREGGSVGLTCATEVMHDMEKRGMGYFGNTAGAHHSRLFTWEGLATGGSDIGDRQHGDP